MFNLIRIMESRSWTPEQKPGYSWLFRHTSAIADAACNLTVECAKASFMSKEILLNLTGTAVIVGDFAAEFVKLGEGWECVLPPRRSWLDFDTAIAGKAFDAQPNVQTPYRTYSRTAIRQFAELCVDSSTRLKSLSQAVRIECMAHTATHLPSSIVSHAHPNKSSGLLTDDEAAAYLKLDGNYHKALERYRMMGVLKGTRVGRRIKYQPVELDRFLERQTKP
jgi:hypothetical protein